MKLIHFSLIPEGTRGEKKKIFRTQDEKDIVNGCNHLVNELGNLKEAMGSENLENLELAKAVAKDFAEVTEQSVNRYD